MPWASKARVAEGKAGPKGDTGGTGPAGKDGAQGIQGIPGTNGTNGTNGTDGTDGEDGVCSVGNPECILPPGATETGAWYLLTSGGGEGFAAISFPMRLSAEISEANTHGVTKELIENEEVPAGCTVEGVEGSAENPLAQPGHLCVYMGPSSEGEPLIFSAQKIAGSGLGGASTAGARLTVFEFEGGKVMQGTFAVTG